MLFDHSPDACSLDISSTLQPHILSCFITRITISNKAVFQDPANDKCRINILIIFDRLRSIIIEVVSDHVLSYSLE